jgi:hypothetical protein
MQLYEFMTEMRGQSAMQIAPIEPIGKKRWGKVTQLSPIPSPGRSLPLARDRMRGKSGLHSIEQFNLNSTICNTVMATRKRGALGHGHSNVFCLAIWFRLPALFFLCEKCIFQVL